ncbi:MAG: MFS transporter [Acidimicrobiales bacterium]
MPTNRWFGVLAHRDFRLYFIGRATSFIGTGMIPVALSFAILGRGGSTSEVGWVLSADVLPLALFLLVAGVLADRINRRVVMLGADVLRCAAQAALAVWIITGRPPLWGFIVLEFVVGIGTAFFTPAMTGLIPQVTTPETLHQANALNGVAQWGGTLVGPAIAGALVATVGSGWAVAADAISYAISVVCLVLLRVGWSGIAGEEESLARQLIEGWQAFRSRTWLWSVVAQFCTLGLIVFPPFFVLGAVVAKQSLGGAVGWGIVLACQGGGATIAAILMLRIQPRRPMLAGELALLSWSVILLVLALRAPLPVVAVAGFVSGAGFGVFGPVWDTTMQRQLPPEVLSRASAYDWFGSMVLLPIGFAIEGWVSSLLGVDGTLWLGTTWLLLTVVVVLALPSVRRMTNEPIPEVVAAMRARPHGEEGFGGGHGPPFLGVERRAGSTIS